MDLYDPAGTQGGTDKSSMNKTRFVKCIRDCQLISEAIGGLNQTLVDDYFAKVLPPAQDRCGRGWGKGLRALFLKAEALTPDVQPNDGG